MFYRLMLLLFSLMAMSCYTQEASAATKWRHCIRMSFPDNDLGTMTNLCSENLYATWVDDHGNHTTAIGKNAILNIGRIHGRFQIEDADLQSGVLENANSTTKLQQGPSRLQTCMKVQLECNTVCDQEYANRFGIDDCHGGCIHARQSCISTGRVSSTRVGISAANANLREIERRRQARFGDRRNVASPTAPLTPKNVRGCQCGRGVNCCAGGRAWNCNIVGLVNNFTTTLGDPTQDKFCKNRSGAW